VRNLDLVGWTPYVLSGVLLLFAVATLGHTLVVSVRQRRRDLAVLKSLGFVRRQVTAAVAWQATTLMLLVMIIGVPLGIVAGNWAWRVAAGQLGVAAEPVTPVAAVALALPLALVVANAVAALPARTAGRIRPAAVLRTE
jgi:ABC-type antimicrobial peptide transport system permease subunit